MEKRKRDTLAEPKKKCSVDESRHYQPIKNTQTCIQGAITHEQTNGPGLHALTEFDPFASLKRACRNRDLLVAVVLQFALRGSESYWNEVHIGTMRFWRQT